MSWDLTSLANGPGIYFFKNHAGKIIYIGQSSQLQNRLRTYLNFQKLGPKTKKLMKETKSFETISVTSPLEATLLESKLIRDYHPKYNLRGKDDKSFLFIKIEAQNPIPTLSLTRKIKKDHAVYYGPFPKSWLTKSLLRSIRHLFPYCTCPGAYQKNCLYRQLNLCTSPAVNQSSIKYQEVIGNLMTFLEGKVYPWSAKLQSDLARAVKQEDYERAVLLRDQLFHLKSITRQKVPLAEYLINPNLASDVFEQELSELRQVLLESGLNLNTVSRIEAYDISHLAGKNSVGSMVVFLNGQARPDHYRRFRIKTEETSDDLRMITEVMSRRFRKREKRDRSFSAQPDLIIVDGGQNQIQAVIEVLEEKSLNIPTIGIVKKSETLVVPPNQGQRFISIRLDLNNKASCLIQRIRDEAHRFAITYHRQLREKFLLKG